MGISKVKTRKMKLTMVRNTVDGIEQIGCRASGVYQGYVIERTSWVPFTGANLILDGTLKLLATGQYNKEMRRIDELNNAK